ncbi:MAG: chloride channel protein [Bacteroidetes bacterium]|jgi:CIC family chloride channel protein|nr:chloride channel protein [Bacteroidota bacterium]
MNLRKLNYAEKGIDWIHDKLNEKQFLIFSSILVGVSAGLAAVILKLFVHSIRHYLMEEQLLRFDIKYLYLLLPLLGIALTVFITQRFFKGNLNKGADSILFAIAKKGSFLPFSQMYSHIFTSGITVGFGGSSGLESPIVSTGSAIGSNYAKRYKLTYRERTLLLAAGAAGGIAGAFNAPIAGILFALEVLLVDISITAFIPLLIASASGALISKIILQENILLYFKLKQPFDYHNVPYYIIIGLIAGLVSLYHVNFFEKVDGAFKKIKSVWLRVLLAGVSLATLYAFFPALFGEGYESIKDMADLYLPSLYKDSVLAGFITNSWAVLAFVCATFLIKSAAVGITLGSGGNGGNFAPSLFVGAYLGFTIAFLLKLMGFQNIPVTNFILVSMAGTLCGVFHAPLTAIFLIAEITGGYELIIPLMIVSSISYVIVKYFHPDSADVRKLKKRGTVISEDKDTSILGQIEIESLIEKDFHTIYPDEKLRSIVEKIKDSRRNIFPVVNKNNKLLGIITLDNIKQEMFNQELYDNVIAKELMEKPETKIRLSEDIFVIMKKFEESGQWNLPVTDKGYYVGFLSKSSILTKYRNQLLQSVV